MIPQHRRKRKTVEEKRQRKDPDRRKKAEKEKKMVPKIQKEEAHFVHPIRSPTPKRVEMNPIITKSMMPQQMYTEESTML